MKSVSRRDLISVAVPLTASLICGSASAQSGTPKAVEVLRGKLTGQLFTRSDPGYGTARRVLGTTPVDDRFPELVVLPAGPEDIARTLEFARTQRLDVSLRSGGHDSLGASTIAGGVVIDLSALNAITVDAASGIARAGAGARAAMLSAAAGPYGLAPVLGTFGHVGLGGLTLGGGIGWLCGSHGAAVDNLLAVEMVIADGRFVRASARENPDLFWALRGGGGNFGVATTFTYQLQPVSQVLAGTLVFKTEIASFLRFMRGFLAASPDALDLVIVLPAQPRQTAFVRLCWSGNVEEGQRVVGNLKAFSAPVVDMVKPQSHAAFFASDPPMPFENQLWRGGEFDGLNDAAIDAISSILDQGGPETCAVGIMHYMHGALCRVPAGSTPLIRPPGHILYNVAGAWNGASPPEDKHQWVLSAADQLRRVSTEQTYINYLSYEGAKPVRDAYGPFFSRLSAIKHRYDPQNVFHNNRNINV